MARYEERSWAPTDTSGSRAARQYGRYQAYIPDKLVGRPFAISGPAAADIADAERALAALNATAATLTHTEGLARLLLRAESVASSRIEGLTIASRRLLRADFATENNIAQTDTLASEILANIEAMDYAVHTIDDGRHIDVPLLLAAHRRLLHGSALARHGGIIRDRQNWIGGNNYNPMGADFVPPPPDIVEELLEDLCAFSNDDNLPAVAQAAIAHAQFETIHPFVDGNGRVGRALIQLVLRKRELTTNVTLPISLILAARADEYVNGLTATRYIGNATSNDAARGMNQWFGSFASACTRSVADAVAFEKRISRLQDDWRTRLAPVRANSATDLLIRRLPGTPVTSLAALSKSLDRTLSSVTEAVERFEKAGILRAVNVGRVRGQTYEAGEIIEAFTDFERGLASPVPSRHL